MNLLNTKNKRLTLLYIKTKNCFRRYFTFNLAFIKKDSLYKPGPGTYASTDNINNLGRYTSSKF